MLPLIRSLFKIRTLICIAIFGLITSPTAGAADKGKPRESFFRKAIRDALHIDAIRREFVFAKLPEEDLRLDIYYPRAAPPEGGYPLIVWIHGGGWILGSKRQDVFVRHFPRYGYAVASVEYRLAQEQPFPAQLHDARTATSWLWKNARELDLNPDAFVVAGQSAGAHLGLLMAYTEGEAHRNWGPTLPPGTIKAVAALYPPTDLLRLVPPDARDNPLHPVAILLGDKVDHRIELARQASPIRHVRSENPPTLLLHGKSDAIVPVEQSIRLAEKLKANGVPNHLILTDGGHAFTLYPDKVNDLLEFFKTIPALQKSTNGFQATPTSAPSNSRRPTDGN